MSIALAVAAIMAIGGCSSDRHVGPVSAPDPGPASGAAPQFLSYPQSPQAVDLGWTRTSSYIRAQFGGELRVGNVVVTIPANALTNDARIELALADLENVDFTIDGGGAGLAHPIQIRVEQVSRRTDAGQGQLVLFESDDSGFTPLPSTHASDAVQAVVSSFGEFGLGKVGDDGEIDFVRYLCGPGYLTQLVSASQGGRVVYDRFTLVFPAGALSEDTYITIRNPGNGHLQCELEPHGIHFNVPVQLQMNLWGLRWQPYRDWTIYWWNDNTAAWENQGGTFQNYILSVNLAHFSDYEAGRAGW